jgi:hypothetical protein
MKEETRRIKEEDEKRWSRCRTLEKRETEKEVKKNSSAESKGRRRELGKGR